MSDSYLVPVKVPRIPAARFCGFALGILGAGSLAIGWMGSEEMLRPTRRPLEPRHREALDDPARFGMVMGAIFEVPTTDGYVLKARMLRPAKDPGEAVKTRRMRDRLSPVERLPWGETRGTVVMLHGRSGIKEDAFPVAERFVAAGFSCLVYDARAHGESGGDFATYGVRESGDLSRVLDATEARYGSESLEPWLGFGISQGAAVLVQALPGEPRLQAGVAVAPFSRLEPVLERAVANRISPHMPSVLTWSVMTLGSVRGGFDAREVNPVTAASRIGVPLMVVHGEEDGVIPLAQGRAVFEALPEGRGHRWRVVPEGRHGNVLATGGDELYHEMISFWVGALEGSTF